MNRIAAMLLGLTVCLPALAQRTYVDNSVLSTGDWYRFAVTGPGLCRVDGAFLSRLGVSLPVPSTAIRLFGNGGGMLPENNASQRRDDLSENALSVEDGGDGSFGPGDHFLFHADGADRWLPDSSNRRFTHVRNLYSSETFYYLTIGGQGLRIQEQPLPAAADFVVEQFDERYYRELDSLNFLGSGKQWYGEEFGTGPGRQPSRTFSLSVPGLVAGAPVTVVSEVLARSVGQPARFDVTLNGTPLHRHLPAPLPGVLYEPLATPSRMTGTVAAAASPLSLAFGFTPGSVNAQGWLDWYELFCRRSLDLSGLSQLLFRHWEGVSPGRTAEYLLRNAAAGLRVWDVTDPLRPVSMRLSVAGGQARFRNDASRLREYLAFTGAEALVPRAIGKLPNQNLHRPQFPQMVILTTAALSEQARRLADHHLQRDRISSLVVDVQQVYHEFSSGIPDPTALRDFVRMFRDRAGADTARQPRYLLLMGDASYDYRGRITENTNLVPSWQSPGSLDPLDTHTSDDFFGMLDPWEDVNNPLLPVTIDIGIGRIPAETPAEARTMVDKVVRYHSAASLGPWRSTVTLVADDEDQNLHLQDAEFHASTLAQASPATNLQKIYLDAFRQESGAGGSRYPQVNAAVNSRIFTGTLLWNYSGHGGSRRLAQEAILDEEMAAAWNNAGRLPLFVTATCDFAPYDNPLVKSIGERILLSSPNGGIALMTTTRLVFAYSNRIMNNNYLRSAFTPSPSGGFPSLGDAVRLAKNLTYRTSGDLVNNRKFTLLGDPALTLGFPKAGLRILAVNGRPVGAATDTLRALNRYTLTGEVTDLLGRPLAGFNGTAYPSVYDKEQSLSTLANDPGSSAVDFRSRPNPLYNGKVRVSDGRFSFSFVVPKDINYGIGKGRVALYAENGETEAGGLFEDFQIGGLGNGVRDDGAGPSIRAFLNDEKFVNGGITNEAPVLVVRLEDSTGINTSGTGIGHDITAVIDDNAREAVVLNDYFEAAIDSDRKGTIRYQLPRLSEGPHRILVKAWDVFNNSADYLLECRVVRKEELELRHVLNYPNPFTRRTRFLFEHNRPGEDLQVRIEVMSLTGRVVRRIESTVRTEGNRSDGIEWDGLDDYGAPLARGVYVYRLQVRTADGRTSVKTEKLAIL